MAISATKTVREVAAEVPGATRLFEKLGIDYCCGGGHSLEQACASAGVEVSDVLTSLEGHGPQPDEFKDWQAESLSALIAYILDKHHAFTRGELDRIEPLLTKVCSVYGDQRPELLHIRGLFKELKQELLTHMQKEEAVLFPYVEEMAKAVKGGARAPRPFFGTVCNPVRMMMIEHDAAGHLLRNIRAASLNFAVPEGVCISYRALYEALEGLEADLHEHIHLENNILFPRAVEMESLG